VRRAVLALTAAGVLLGLSAAPASAAPVPCLGIGGLQDALDTATPGSTVQLIKDSHCTTAFHFSAGHVPITLDGNGSTLDGSTIIPKAPILSGVDVQNTTIENLTFVHGNLPSGNGAALSLTGSSLPRLIHDSFFDNVASAEGGAVAIYCSATTGTVTVSHSTFGSAAQPNRAGLAGGAMWVHGSGTGSPSLSLTGDRFIDNSGGNVGGGLDFVPFGTHAAITITGSIFSGNTVKYGGGGAALVFSEMSAGAIPHATLIGNIFSGNHANTGSNFANAAGLEIDGFQGLGLLTQIGNTFKSNSIHKTSGTETYSSEGAGELDNGVPLSSRADRFTGNSLTSLHAGDTAQGAGLAVEGCLNSLPRMPVSLSDAVVAGNRVTGPAPADGAGLYVGACSAHFVALSLRDSTVAGNTTSNGDGGVFGDPTDTLVAQNSIIADNPGGSTDINGFASRSVDHSDACSSGTAPAGTGNFCAIPKLLAATSGNVHETSSSPTIDKGANAEVPAGLTKDAYGDPRITDGRGSTKAIVDMGAAESPALAPCVVPKLKGRSKTAASKALKKAYCALGRVKRRKPAKPRHGKHKKAKSVVVAQSRRPGTKLPRGSKVGITLGPKPKP